MSRTKSGETRFGTDGNRGPLNPRPVRVDLVFTQAALWHRAAGAVGRPRPAATADRNAFLSERNRRVEDAVGAADLLHAGRAGRVLRAVRSVVERAKFYTNAHHSGCGSGSGSFA